ncbi:MAG: peptidyl-prolyl cis-trans isomerase [Candidatus Omnitrophica bacterium]|nr:peptidyl-prolyl cis-trans isomerase [Candidatus Omnitrophota bacterium]MDD5238255.1 peptidyl-prolyl cis-trans isomerase [Candidatus Omnitrophota bacterium]
MHKYRNFLILMALISISLGCENFPLFQSKQKKPAQISPPVSANVVAKVGNFYITSDDLNKEVESFNSLIAAQGMPQNKIDSRDKKIDYLRNEVVRKYILYQEALDRGLDKREEIAKALENAKISLLVTELLRGEIEKIDVTSKEIEDFYNQNKDALREPEQRRILEIVAPSEDEAKQVYIELLKGADFASSAKQYSKAASSSKGGDLGFIALDPDPSKRIRFDKFYEVAFSPSLETGSISSIFKGPEGYYIIKLESVKKSEAKSLSELWDNIKSWLLFEKQQKAIADLASKLSGETKIEIYEGKVE